MFRRFGRAVFLRKPQRWRPEINLLLVYRGATLPDILMMSPQGISDEEVVLTQFNRKLQHFHTPFSGFVSG
jgi:hypothetical protein